MRKPADNANDIKQVKSYLNKSCTIHTVYVRDLQDYKP